VLLVIAGAGASYDSAPDYPILRHNAAAAAVPDRPPLAMELFATRPEFLPDLDVFPQCKPIIPHLRPRPDHSIETELERLQKEAETNPRRHRQLAAVRFYLQRMLTRCGHNWYEGRARGVTNYLTLIDAIQNYGATSLPVTIVTFNYDRLIERALHEIGIEISQLEHYIADPNCKLIKLHGSVDWAHEVETTIRAVNGRNEQLIQDEIIDRAAELRISRGYLYTPAFQAWVAASGSVLFPALAIPVARKQQFECPPDHVEALQRCLPSVRKILIVGWRGTETHFLDMLRAHLQGHVQALAVCGEQTSGAAVLSELVAAEVPISSGEAFNGGFSEFILSSNLTAFLHATR
jgi:hypothetical protein